MNKQKLRFALAATVILAAAGAGINVASTHGRTAGKESPLRLVLNVPAHKIFVYENGQLTREFRVGVGMVGNETPAGSYRITQAIWNPWWNPPPSPWAEGRKPEPPGPGNPMGRVKMNFAPLLYIHGTQYRSAVGDPSSHGCVHVMNDDLIELARIVHKYATPGLDTTEINELADNPSETREINFKNAIPFDVTYSVAAVSNGFLYIYPDVYGRVRKDEYAAQVRDVLAENGINADQVDQSRLEELMTRGQENRVAVSLDELRASAAATTPPAASATASTAASRSKPETAKRQANKGNN